MRRHVNRLEKTSPDSMEATVTRNYLEWIFGLPWQIFTTDNLDIDHAKTVLDEDHYGLKEIKDRILRFYLHTEIKNRWLCADIMFCRAAGNRKNFTGTIYCTRLRQKLFPHIAGRSER